MYSTLSRSNNLIKKSVLSLYAFKSVKPPSFNTEQKY